MKKIIIISYLILISFIDSYGQLYVKKYQVTDINFLSKLQLEESLGNSIGALLFTSCTAITGGVIFIIFKYLRPGMSDDPSVIEQILVDEGVNKVGIITGIGILIGGSIASIAYLGRIGRIKSVINKNYPPFGSIDISPAIILNRYTRSPYSGFTLTYKF
jgi:hypothetical protein